MHPIPKLALPAAWLGAMLFMAAAAPGQTAAGKVNFTDQILPIFRQACIGCHNADKAKSGLQVDDYNRLMQGGSSGVDIVPGKPEESRLYLLVTHQEEPAMPLKQDKLPADKLELIRAWILQGAPIDAAAKAAAQAAPAKPKVLPVLLPVNQGPPPMPRGLPSGPLHHTPRPLAVTALAASPTAPVLAVPGSRQVLLYHTDTAALLGVLDFPEGLPLVLKFSRDGRMLIAGGGMPGASGSVVVWEVETGKRFGVYGKEYDAVMAADISPDLKQLAVGGSSKKVRVFSTSTGQMVYEIKKHTDFVTSLCFSPDSILLASGDRSGGLFVWESSTGRPMHELRGHTGAVNGLCYRGDAEILASAGDDGTVRMWEMEDGKPVRSWAAHGGGVFSVHFAPDHRVATTGQDRLVKVWQEGGQLIRAFPQTADWTYQAQFTFGGKRVAAGVWNGDVPIWELADGKQAAKLTSDP